METFTKGMKKAAIASLVFVLAVTGNTALADTVSIDQAVLESVSTTSATPEIDEVTKQLADPYVSLSGDQFVVAEDAKDVLTEVQFEQVEESVATANREIRETDQETNAEKKILEDSVVFSQQVGPRVSNSDTDDISPYFQNGRNGIEYHWWGVRILLSQNTVRAIGAGTTIAGVWVPEPVVTKILSTLGAVVALAPGGVWADYTYAQFALVPVNPLFATPFRVGFQ